MKKAEVLQTWDTLEAWEASFDFNAIRDEITYTSNTDGVITYYYGCLSHVEWFLYETLGTTTKLIYQGNLKGFLDIISPKACEFFLARVTVMYIQALAPIAKNKLLWPGRVLKNEVGNV